MITYDCLEDILMRSAPVPDMFGCYAGWIFSDNMILYRAVATRIEYCFLRRKYGMIVGLTDIFL